jgi:hypothetical protein
MPVRLTAHAETADLAIDYRPLGSLIPYARNDGTHSESQVALIAGSIGQQPLEPHPPFAAMHLPEVVDPIDPGSLDFEASEHEPPGGRSEPVEAWRPGPARGSSFTRANLAGGCPTEMKREARMNLNENGGLLSGRPALAAEIT